MTKLTAMAIGTVASSLLAVPIAGAETELHELPGLFGLLYQHRATPKMRIVRKRQVKVLIILSCEHHITSIDPTREEGHAFIVNRLPVKSQDTEVKEVLGLHELG